jgi:ribosomal protein S15P/S13E
MQKKRLFNYLKRKTQTPKKQIINKFKNSTEA